MERDFNEQQHSGPGGCWERDDESCVRSGGTWVREQRVARGRSCVAVLNDLFTQQRNEQVGAPVNSCVVLVVCRCQLPLQDMRAAADLIRVRAAPRHGIKTHWRFHERFRCTRFHSRDRVQVPSVRGTVAGTYLRHYHCLFSGIICLYCH